MCINEPLDFKTEPKQHLRRLQLDADAVLYYRQKNSNETFENISFEVISREALTDMI